MREVCAAGRKRGIPVVLDADEPRHDSNELLASCRTSCSRRKGLRATAGTDHLGRALVDVSKHDAARSSP